MSNEIKKDWERPWTTEEIIEQADNWNLACDAALLNTLKSFGDKFLQQSEDVYKKVESLCDDLEETNLRVDLARNEFNSLRNTQFVECRVYEEDETLLTEQQEKEPKNNVPKDETLEDLKGAVALGLEILDKYYDTVRVTVSDSEDEDEDIPSYVYRRKDPYISRPLPYIIGSEEWHKKWHVGLLETDSENEKSSSDKFSDSESEDNFQAKDQSDVSSELSNLSGLNYLKGQPVAVSTANTTQQDVTSVDESTTTSTPKPLSFAEQLAAKLGNVIKENEALFDEPQVNKRPIQKKPSDYGALFSDEPPPLDDISQPDSQGIFSGGKGLFDDEDEDDSFWNPGKSSITSKNDPVHSVISADKYTKEVQNKGLFDEDSDDDIFTSSQKTKTDTKNTLLQPYLQTKKIQGPIFDEEPPLFEEPKSSKEKKKPTGGVSVFGDANIFQNNKIGAILKPRKSSSSENSDDEVSRTNVVEKGPIPTEIQTSIPAKNDKIVDSNKQTISPVPQLKETVHKKLPGIENLFEDDILPPVIKETSETKRSGLFDDDIFGDDLFSGFDNRLSKNSFNKSGLFSDDEADELFSPTLNLPKDVTSKKEVETISKKTPKPKTNSEVLENNDESRAKSLKTQNISLFNDDEEDDLGIFKPKEKPRDIKEIKSTSAGLSLFNDDFEDDDDLFSEILKSSWKPKNSAKESEGSSGFPENVIEKPIVFPKPVISDDLKENEQSVSLKEELGDFYSEHSRTVSPYKLDDVNESLSAEVKPDIKKNETTSNITENKEQNIKVKVEDKFDHMNLQLQDDDWNPAVDPSPLSSSSMNVHHVSFLDSNPPPDDAWDNGSDNAFDDPDPYGNDDFQSQPSSLFDNEPPSLFFNDTSGIVRDVGNNRLDSVNSFDPTVTSSRRFSSDIFSDSQNNNSLFLTKNQDSANVIEQPNLRSVKEISYSNGEDNTDITPSGNPDELYHSNSVDDVVAAKSSGEVDEPRNQKVEKWNGPRRSDFANTISDSFDSINNNKIGAKPPIAKKKPITKDMSSTNSNKNATSGDSIANLVESTDQFDKDETDDVKFAKQIDSKYLQDSISESVISDKNVSIDRNSGGNERFKSEVVPEQDSDEMQNNIAKIAEQLRKQTLNKDEEKSKSKVTPRKINHNLSINVGALLPGAAPPKKDKISSPVSPSDSCNSSQSSPRLKTEKESGKEESSGLLRKPIPIVRAVSESAFSKKEYKLEKSVSFDGSSEVEVLQSITKDRPRIPVKRKPSSRRARQQSFRNSVPDFKLITNDDSESKDVTSSSSLLDDSVQIKDTQDTASIEDDSKGVTKISEDDSKSDYNTVEPEDDQQLKKSDDSVFNEAEDLFESIQKKIESVIEAKLINLKKEDDGNGLFGSEMGIEKKNLKTEKLENVLSNKEQMDSHKSTIEESLFKKEINKSDEELKDDLFGEKQILNVTSDSKKSKIDNLFDSSDDSDDFLKNSNTKLNSKRKQETINKNVKENTSRSKVTQSRKSKLAKNLFDSSDDDDFFESLGAVKSVKDEKTSDLKTRTTKDQDKLLDDTLDSTTSSGKTKQDIETSVISKKPPKSSSLRKLENVEGDEDPLSALLK